MALLIDASILIEHERERLDLETQIEHRSHTGKPTYLSVVTASELLHGVHRAYDPEIRTRRRRWIEGLLAEYTLLSIDLPTAREHARIWADLASRGEIIGPNDLWLAATCLAHDLTLATGNVREFWRVEGLEVEDWTEDA